MTSKAIDICVNEIYLNLKVKYSSIEDVEENLDDAIHDAVDWYISNNDLNNNKKIITKIYKQDIIDVMLNYDITNLESYSKKQIYAMCAYQLLLNDILNNYKDKIIQELIDYLENE